MPRPTYITNRKAAIATRRTLNLIAGAPGNPNPSVPSETNRNNSHPGNLHIGAGGMGTSRGLYPGKL